MSFFLAGKVSNSVILQKVSQARHERTFVKKPQMKSSKQKHEHLILDKKKLLRVPL